MVAVTTRPVGSDNPKSNASMQFTEPAINPLILAMNNASEADTFRVRLLSIAQQRQAKAINKGLKFASNVFSTPWEESYQMQEAWKDIAKGKKAHPFGKTKNVFKKRKKKLGTRTFNEE